MVRPLYSALLRGGVPGYIEVEVVYMEISAGPAEVSGDYS